MQRKIGDATPFLLLAFGFGLAAFGVQQWVPANSAFFALAVYGTLVAALGEFVGGVLVLINGNSYVGSIGLTFGSWLFANFLMFAHGIGAELFHPYSAGLYGWVLFIPVAIIAIPSFKLKIKPFMAVFITLLAMLITQGLATMPIASALLWARATSVLAILSAFILWYVAWTANAALIAEMTAPPQK